MLLKVLILIIYLFGFQNAVSLGASLKCADVGYATTSMQDGRQYKIIYRLEDCQRWIREIEVDGQPQPQLTTVRPIDDEWHDTLKKSDGKKEFHEQQLLRWRQDRSQLVHLTATQENLVGEMPYFLGRRIDRLTRSGDEVTRDIHISNLTKIGEDWSEKNDEIIERYPAVNMLNQ